MKTLMDVVTLKEPLEPVGDGQQKAYSPEVGWALGDPHGG